MDKQKLPPKADTSAPPKHTRAGAAEFLEVIQARNAILEHLARAAVGSTLAWSRMPTEKRNEQMDIARAALKSIVTPLRANKKKKDSPC